MKAHGLYNKNLTNKFSISGVTGYSKIVSKLTPLSASRFTMITNIVLLVVGFLMVGRSFGIKTVYASIVFSYALDLMERYIPLHTPLTNQTLL